MTGKKTMAYCGRCEKDTSHKRGRRCRWHCLTCGVENVGLRRQDRTNVSLPPGFILEERADGESALYVAVAVANKEHVRKKTMYYLKGTFDRDVAYTHIKNYAWQVYRGA